MNRLEFLEKLKEALEQDLGPQAVQDNVNYYNQYIMDEVRGGKAESGGHFGLGLHICKLLCEKQGGGLRLQNAPGGGAMAQAFFRVS